MYIFFNHFNYKAYIAKNEVNNFKYSRIKKGTSDYCRGIELSESHYESKKEPPN